MTAPQILAQETVIVEGPATYPGGMGKLYEFFSKKMKYPKEAKQNGITGKVFVQFIVDLDGSITEAKVAEGLGHGCDEEVLRLLKLSEPWQAGDQNGHPVRQSMTILVLFKR